jgi:phosphatidylserine/phosphatidylglycerophosphate/cardiolipin synthase-like enzyme
MPMGSLASMLDLLEQKVKQKGFQKLVVFCTRIAEVNDELMGIAAAHRRVFVQRLVDAGGKNVVFCQYKSNSALGNGLPGPDSAPFYVHSKTWIFDDELLIVGSANCNRRGYSHDSELDLAVYDVEKNAIRELRKRIWLRRLNTEGVATPVTDTEVNDFVSAAEKLWEDPATRKLTIENHRPSVNAFVPVSVVQSALATTWQAVIRAAVPGAAPDVGLWNSVVDPEGT